MKNKIKIYKRKTKKKTRRKIIDFDERSCTSEIDKTTRHSIGASLRHLTVIVSSLYILTRQRHARGKKRTVPFLNFLDLSSVSTRLLCILFCSCDFFRILRWEQMESKNENSAVSDRPIINQTYYSWAKCLSFSFSTCWFFFISLLNLVLLYISSFLFVFSFFILLLYYCYFNKHLIQIRHLL